MLHSGIKKNFLAGLSALQRVERVARLDRLDPVPGGCEIMPVLLQTDARALLERPELAREVFGPAAMVVVCDSADELRAVAESLAGQLTASVHGEEEDWHRFGTLFGILQRKVGRLICNGFPTGVEVCPSMVHGGPFPAASDARFTSVGTRAIARFARPVCYQNLPDSVLPEELQDANPLGLLRLVDGVLEGLG